MSNEINSVDEWIRENIQRRIKTFEYWRIIRDEQGNWHDNEFEKPYPSENAGWWCESCQDHFEDDPDTHVSEKHPEVKT